MPDAPLTHTPPGVIADVVTPAIPEDERVWVPQAPNVWFRPLLLNTVTGGWCNLLRVRRAGVLSRHRHPMIVTGYVIKGSWRYLEHDWVATAGSFVYETPGEAHTLVAYESDEPMKVHFKVRGPLIWLDEDGNAVDFFDVHNYIEICKEHYEKVGLGADLIDSLLR